MVTLPPEQYGAGVGTERVGEGLTVMLEVATFVQPEAFVTV
jgi:hypothetical protein